MDKKSKDELILKYYPFVKNVVLRMASSLPVDRADTEDLVNVGIIGLMSAIEKFDSKRNVRFETFAYLRIKGAVWDELRHRDRVTRTARFKAGRIENAFSELRKELGRQPEEEEIAAHLGVSLGKYYDLLDDAKGVSLLSTEDLPPDFLEKHSSENVADLLESDNPLASLIGGELMTGLKNAIDKLPQKERLVVSLYYYDELTMKEIGKVMDITESRVCQLHTQAVLRLRNSVNEYK
jgi:RNA polymerase sigma factor for flagellar operon FliA